jgi:hypothetical protein
MDTLHEDLQVFLQASWPWLTKYLPEWKIFQTKVIEKN